MRLESGVAAETLIRLGASLGAASLHPVSRAIAGMWPADAREALSDLRELGGFGVTGSLDGTTLALGRPDLFARIGVCASPPPAHDGPIVGVSHGERFLGWLLFADEARAEARAASPTAQPRPDPAAPADRRPGRGRRADR